MPAPADTSLVTVATYLYPWEAHIARGRLETEGVAAFVADDEVVRMNWGYAQAIGGVKLLVCRPQLADAKRILADVAAGLYAGEIEGVPEDILRCPQCSSTRIGTERSGLSIALMLVAVLDWLALPMPKQHRCLDCSHRWPA